MSVCAFGHVPLNFFQYSDVFKLLGVQENYMTTRTSFVSDNERLEYHWRQFTAEFPTEEDCVQELYKRVYGHEIKCPACYGNRVKKLHNSRIIVCHQCRKETYILSGTFFHNIREARRWLAAIWFTDHGIKLNASSFARLVQVVRATADAIFKKLSFVIIGKMSGLPEISSREFIATYRKRSRLTPAGEHPSAEQTEIEKQNCADDKLSTNSRSPDVVTDSANSNGSYRESKKTWFAGVLSEREETVYKALSSKPIHVEILLQQTGLEVGPLSAALVLLEFSGLVRRQTGDWYSRAEPPVSSFSAPACPLDKKVKLTIDSFTNFVCCTFNGISRKYVQNYLGWYWCIIDRERWAPGALLDECAGFPKTSLKRVLQYVSPLAVNFSPLPAE